jgi:hypothetical protein
MESMGVKPSASPCPAPQGSPNIPISSGMVHIGIEFVTAYALSHLARVVLTGYACPAG